jgi:hypothetical protein
MKLMNMPEAVIDWSRLLAATIAGASGTMRMRAHQSGDIRLRLVEYSAGYLADHWCSKGHILQVLAGTLAIEHQDGTPASMLSAGMSWQVADGESPTHRVRSETGAAVFIVD